MCMQLFVQTLVVTSVVWHLLLIRNQTIGCPQLCFEGLDLVARTL